VTYLRICIFILRIYYAKSDKKFEFKKSKEMYREQKPLHKNIGMDLKISLKSIPIFIVID